MTYFLWPEGQLSFRALFPPWGSSISHVESLFSVLFPNSYPVLFSSARAGITGIFEWLKLGREDRVWLPPYSSHCLLDAVSRFATPTSDLKEQELKTILIYHQWGYLHPCATSAVLIEDSADTFCLPQAPLFPNNGRFELFSLPKIIGSAAGGLVFCRTQTDAEGLRELREARPQGGVIHWSLRTVFRNFPSAQAYWAGFEPQNGCFPRLLCKDIEIRLRTLPSLIQDRQRKYNLLKPFLSGGLKTAPQRLPSVVPIECNSMTEQCIRELGVTTGFRHIHQQKVLPIPIHQGVPEVTLQKIVHILGSKP